MRSALVVVALTLALASAARADTCAEVKAENAPLITEIVAIRKSMNVSRDLYDQYIADEDYTCGFAVATQVLTDLETYFAKTETVVTNAQMDCDGFERTRRLLTEDREKIKPVLSIWLDQYKAMRTFPAEMRGGVCEKPIK